MLETKEAFLRSRNRRSIFFCVGIFSPSMLFPVCLMVGILGTDLSLHKLFNNFLSLFYACLDEVNVLLQINNQDLTEFKEILA